MKKITPLFLMMILVITILSCGSNEGVSVETKKADSLFEVVMDGHDLGMGKMARLTRAEQTSRHLLDSIKKLPARASKAAEPLRVKLDSLQKDLSYAEFAMDKWMKEFDIDSAKNIDAKLRIVYLESENGKVKKVTEAILGSLQKADSVLQNNLK